MKKAAAAATATVKRREKEHISERQQKRVVYLLLTYGSQSVRLNKKSRTASESNETEWLGNHYCIIESGRNTTVGFNTRQIQFLFLSPSLRLKHLKDFHVISEATRWAKKIMFDPLTLRYLRMCSFGRCFHIHIEFQSIENFIDSDRHFNVSSYRFQSTYAFEWYDHPTFVYFFLHFLGQNFTFYFFTSFSQFQQLHEINMQF